MASSFEQRSLIYVTQLNGNKFKGWAANVMQFLLCNLIVWYLFVTFWVLSSEWNTGYILYVALSPAVVSLVGLTSCLSWYWITTSTKTVDLCMKLITWVDLQLNSAFTACCLYPKCSGKNTKSSRKVHSFGCKILALDLFSAAREGNCVHSKAIHYPQTFLWDSTLNLYYFEHIFRTSLGIYWNLIHDKKCVFQRLNSSTYFLVKAQLPSLFMSSMLVHNWKTFDLLI